MSRPEFDGSYWLAQNCALNAVIVTHMSNTLDQIPVDKTTSPTESSRKMKPEVQ